MGILVGEHPYVLSCRGTLPPVTISGKSANMFTTLYKSRVKTGCKIVGVRNKASESEYLEEMKKL